MCCFFEEACPGIVGRSAKDHVVRVLMPVPMGGGGGGYG